MALNTRLLRHREPVPEDIEEPADGSEFAAGDSGQATAPRSRPGADYSAPLFSSDAARATAKPRFAPVRRWFAIVREWDWRRPISRSRMLKTGIFAVAAAAIALGVVYSEDELNLFSNVKASLFGAPTDQSAAEDTTTPAPENLPNGTSAAYNGSSPFGQSTVGVRGGSSRGTPTHDDIAGALRNARQGQADAGQPQAGSPAARNLNPDAVAALMNHAKAMIGIGDIVAARLLLERAAGTQSADAALMLAQTYDPAVLGNPDARTITPDPAYARSWYQRAAELGSPDAKQRLGQMQN